MVVENFSKKLLQSNIRSVYIATPFFATLIFFVINANAYTPLEMLFGVTLVTIAFKGLANLMVSLVILLFNLDKKAKNIELQAMTSKIDNLLNELALQKTKLATSNKK